MQSFLIGFFEDDVAKFKDSGIDLNSITEIRFEQNMNILNLAIDQQKLNIIEYLDYSLTKRQKIILTSHTYQNGLSAIHQAASLGVRTILDLIAVNFNANLY
jgi:acetamidase/formamidase